MNNDWFEFMATGFLFTFCCPGRSGNPLLSTVEADLEGFTTGVALLFVGDLNSERKLDFDLLLRVVDVVSD
jgi:hypothetical protein